MSHTDTLTIILLQLLTVLGIWALTGSLLAGVIVLAVIGVVDRLRELQ